MATALNVARKIHRLVDSGRIYYGQSSDKLRSVIEAEMTKWKVMRPIPIRTDSFAGYKTDGDGNLLFARDSFGSGPNESIEYCMGTARSILYGCESIDAELIRGLGSDVVAYWRDRLSQINRGSESPYHVTLRQVLQHVMECARLGLPHGLDSNDIRDWKVLHHAAEGRSVYLAMAMEWFARLQHKIGLRWVDMSRVDELDARVAPHRLRIAMVCFYIAEGDAEAACIAQQQFRTVRDAIERLEAMRFLAGETA